MVKLPAMGQRSSAMLSCKGVSPAKRQFFVGGLPRPAPGPETSSVPDWRFTTSAKAASAPIWSATTRRMASALERVSSGSSVSARIRSPRAASMSFTTCWAVRRMSCAVCWKSVAVEDSISFIAAMARSCWSRSTRTAWVIWPPEVSSSRSISFSRLRVASADCSAMMRLISRALASDAASESSMRFM